MIDTRFTKHGPTLKHFKVIKDNKIFFELNDNFATKRVQKINKIDTGTYTFTYSTYFKNDVSIKVHLNEFRKYYIDTIQKDFQPIIDKLKDNESYQIIIRHDDCVAAMIDTLKIEKENGNYTAAFRLVKKKLGLKEIKIIQQFELELNHMPNGGAWTTTDTYYISYKDTLEEVFDGKNKWHGYGHLKKQLFNIDW